MKLRGYQEESFVQYKKPCMFLATSKCDFKCDRECGRSVCQNTDLASADIMELDNTYLIERYLSNTITSSVVIGGLEPFDTLGDTFDFIWDFRKFSDDDIIIYTGYTLEELKLIAHNCLNEFSKLGNVYVKLGRYIPDRPSRVDDILGVELASDNQYCVKL